MQDLPSVPGAMVTTRMPEDFSSRRSDSQYTRTAAFEAQ